MGWTEQKVRAMKDRQHRSVTVTATDSDHSGVQLRSGTRTDVWLGADSGLGAATRHLPEKIQFQLSQMRFLEFHPIRTVKIQTERQTDKGFAGSILLLGGFRRDICVVS
jgi:hypothetical protein